jgi:hypothetical protein
MAFKIEWKPVLQALALSEYHPAYAENTIMVCVNPEPEFWQERAKLMEEYSKRLIELQALMTEARDGSKATTEDIEAAEQKNEAFNQWAQQTFLPGMDDWFARLWSFGDEKWNKDDLNQFESTDSHLLTWLKTRSMEMIEEHRTARKKA